MILTIGALLGFISVGFGAYAEHGIRKKVSAEVFRFVMTGVRYNQIHAVIVSAIGLFGVMLADLQPTKEFDPLFVIAAWGMIIGTILFCFSIYFSAVLDKPGLTKITPVGGIMLMLSWLLLAIAGFTKVFQ